MLVLQGWEVLTFEKWVSSPGSVGAAAQGRWALLPGAAAGPAPRAALTACVTPPELQGGRYRNKYLQYLTTVPFSRGIPGHSKLHPGPLVPESCGSGPGLVPQGRGCGGVGGGTLSRGIKEGMMDKSCEPEGTAGGYHSPHARRKVLL